MEENKCQSKITGVKGGRKQKRLLQLFLSTEKLIFNFYSEVLYKCESAFANTGLKHIVQCTVCIFLLIHFCVYKAGTELLTVQTKCAVEPLLCVFG